MTSLHVRTSKAAIVFALTVFTNLVTTSPKSRFFGNLITEGTSQVASQNQGCNLLQAFDSLVNESVRAVPGYERNSEYPLVHELSHGETTALLALPSGAKQNENALVKAKASVDNETTHIVLDVVLHAVYAMYAVLRHLIDMVYDLLKQSRNNDQQIQIMSRAIVTFAYQFFIKLFTTVMTRAKSKQAKVEPRRNKVCVSTRMLAKVPQVPVNGVTEDHLGKMVLSALLVKRRLEVELDSLQNAVRQGSQLVEVLVNSMGKSNAMARAYNQNILNTINVMREMHIIEDYVRSSKAVVKNMVNTATDLHSINRNDAHHGNSKALVKQIQNRATKLGAELTRVSTAAQTVSVPKELRDEVLRLVRRATLLQ